MPQILFGQQASGEETLAGAPSVARNVLVDGHGVVIRRPGIKAPTDLPTTAIDADGIAGLYSPQDGITDLVAVGGGSTRKIYRVKSTGADDLSTGPASDLRGRNRPVFAETESAIIIAGGEEPQKVFTGQWPADNTAYLSSRLANAPRSTHVASNGARVISNNRDIIDRVNYSDKGAGSSFAGHEDWTPRPEGPGGFFSGESRPDPVVGLYQAGRELFVMGTRTVEVWAPDAQSIYLPVVTREIGCASAYGVIGVDQGMAWLDPERRFQISDGRSFTDITGPMHETFLGLSRVDDVWGFRAILGKAECLVWVFPAAKQAFCYQKGGGWSQWDGWDGSAYKALDINCHVRRRDQADDILGMTDGRLGVLSLDATDDLGDPIQAYVTSGHQSHKTLARKWCKSVRLSFAVRDLAAGETAEVLLSYRDNLGAYGPPLHIRIDSGDREPVVTFRGLGTYRQRDWKLTYIGSAKVALVGMTEDHATLGV